MRGGVVRYHYRTPKRVWSQKCRAGKLEERLWAGVEGLVRVLTPQVSITLLSVDAPFGAGMMSVCNGTKSYGGAAWISLLTFWNRWSQSLAEASAAKGRRFTCKDCSCLGNGSPLSQWRPGCRPTVRSCSNSWRTVLGTNRMSGGPFDGRWFRCWNPWRRGSLMRPAGSNRGTNPLGWLINTAEPWGNKPTVR